MKNAEQRQTLRLLGRNLLAFLMIFGAFSLTIYRQVERELFSPVQKTLSYARQEILSDPIFVERQTTEILMFFSVQQGPEGGESRPHVSVTQPARYSLRVTPVLRNAAGEIINARALGRLYFENRLGEIPVPTAEGIQVMRSSDGSVYRVEAFSISDLSGEKYTVQLLVNIDGEQAVLDNMLRILVLAAGVCVLLSISASFILSRQAIRPLLVMWERQREFVENASHELRTPLAIIQSQLENILARPQSTVIACAQPLSSCLAETRRLAKLSGDLMTLARADSSETEISPAPLDIDAMLDALCEPFKEMATLEGKQLGTSLGFGTEINADADRTKQLLIILLDNALKYTEEGDTIEVRTLRQDNKLILQVADTGWGISGENSERVFERFFREETPNSAGRGGIGLGLSIAHWIVDRHGGTIKAKKNTPNGTVMEVVLPAK